MIRAMRRLMAVLCLSTAALYAQPSVGGISNAASFQQTFSPGSLVAVFGKNMVVSGSASAVLVGGKAGAVITGSTASQLLVQIPVDAPLGPTTLTVTVGGQTSTPVNLTIAAYAPAFFTVNGSGSGAGGFFDAISGVTINAANPAKPSEVVSGVAVGLGATNPALASGVVATAAAKITANASLSISGENAPIGYAGALPNGAPGTYQVNFTLPADASGCGTSIVMTVGGVASPPVAIPITTPLPVICGLQNAATGSTRDAVHGVSANSFVALYAASLGGKDSPASIFPVTSYQGISVTFNGTPVPLYNVLPSVNLITTMVPSDAGSGGTGVFTVKNAAGASQNYTVALAPADVGVFRLPDAKVPTRVQAIALLANTYWFAIPASLAAEYGFPACTGLPVTTPCGQPAKPGDSIVIYLTGGGLATPSADPSGQPVPTGSVAPADGSVVYQTVLKPAITIGGLPATVGFSGIAPGTASEYQINTTIPTGVTPGDDVPIVITIGSSTDTVTIAVKAP
jgi:uncharacterized protein (TIGR03437 family)